MEENTEKKEHILVCLSSSPSNPKVIKAASKMASVFNADFTALFIETSQYKKMSEENKKRLQENTNIAKQNGAKIVTVDGDDIAFQVANYSKTSKVTKIIIGRSGYRPGRLFSPPNFVDKLIKNLPDTEIYVIPDKVQKIYIGQEQTKKENSKFFKLSIKDIFTSALILTLASIIGIIFHKLNINETNIILIYILGVLLIAYTTEYKIYSLVSSVLAVLIFNFLFTEPYLSLKAFDSHYPITFLIMFLVAFFTSSITKKVKAQSLQSSLKAFSMEVMLEMSQKLQQTNNAEEISQVTKDQLKKLIGNAVKLYKSTEDQNEIVEWVIQNNKQAGATTKTYTTSKSLFLPISNTNKVYAVVEIQTKELDEFKKNLIIAMLRESALAYEKDEITETKNQLILKNKQEELRSTFLRAISHDLRTPLTGISGFADILLKNSNLISEEKKLKIYSDIYDDSIWLLNLVENILSITRFDRNEIKIKKESEFLYDVINDALAHLGRKKENYNIQIEIEDESLSAKMDGRLIAQVIFNLVDNAIKYSPSGTNIKVKAQENGKLIDISVIDEGNGINDKDKEKIFDMFYTINNSITDGRRGLGIGLALCKAIVEAHGGKIHIQDNKPKGTIFSFSIESDFNNEI